MKIVHRISLNPNESQLAFLRSHGIEWKNLGIGACVVLINEDHNAWHELAPKVRQWGALDIVTTEFTLKEQMQASSLIMDPSWHHGYPQPEDGFGYLRITYDETDYCPKCGFVGRQKAPFRMLREPKWGNRQILQLNWVYDEYFVTPENWAEVFNPFGIERRSVLNHKTGQELETVVQLDVSDRAISTLRTESFETEQCVSCKRLRFGNPPPGPFPHIEIAKDTHMAKTNEVFGSGAKSYREIIISAALFKAIREHRLKGAEYKLVAEN